VPCDAGTQVRDRHCWPHVAEAGTAGRGRCVAIGEVIKLGHREGVLGRGSLPPSPV
jgi:hypothetical protein